MRTEPMNLENVETIKNWENMIKYALNEFLQLITSLFLKLFTYLYYRSGGGEAPVNGGKKEKYKI